MHYTPYITFPILSDDRILLREVSTFDLKELLCISYYDGKLAFTKVEAASMLNAINKNYADGDSIHWAIVNQENNKIVGTCGYYRGFENNQGELGCVPLPEHQGKGFMFAALKLAIEFGLK